MLQLGSGLIADDFKIGCLLFSSRLLCPFLLSNGLVCLRITPKMACSHYIALFPLVVLISLLGFERSVFEIYI